MVNETKTIKQKEYFHGYYGSGTLYYNSDETLTFESFTPLDETDLINFKTEKQAVDFLHTNEWLPA